MRRGSVQFRFQGGRGQNEDLDLCYNFLDFRELARRHLPGPIFNYIDGAAEDEVTLRRNTDAFKCVDLLPRVLRVVSKVDFFTTIMRLRLELRVYLSLTALQRLFHHQGERATAATAAKFGTIFGVSTIGTVGVAELRAAHDTPQVYQFYLHRDRGLNRTMMDRAKAVDVDVMMLTVDGNTGGTSTSSAFALSFTKARMQRSTLGWACLVRREGRAS